MVHRASLKLFAIVSILGVLLACGLTGGTEPGTNPRGIALTEAVPTAETIAEATAPSTTPTVAVVPSATSTAALTATVEPTDAPPPTKQPLEMTLEGPEIVFHHVRFSLPPGLATPIEASLGADGGAQFDFGNFNTLYISTVESYEGTMADFVPGELQAGLETGSLEQLPIPGAHTYLEAQLQPLDFASGSGFRAVSSGTQSFIPLANNGDLRYVFQGLTADGSYLVALYYDIDASILLSSFDPAMNTNENAFSVPDNFDPEGFDDTHFAFVDDYNAQAAQLLASLSSDGFTPDLAVLDALIRSITIQTEIGP